MQRIEIGGRTVGRGLPCYVIAEAGVNHNGDVGLAAELVDAAAEAGADAVKFQTFTADALASPGAEKAGYQQKDGDHEDQRDMLRRLELPEEAHVELKARCERRGLHFLSSAFTSDALDLVASIDVVAFKIPSGELTDTALLSRTAQKGRPLIVSTGMATMDEVAVALDVIRAAGDPPVVLLHCVSSYPTEPSAVNLRAMQTLEQRFEVPVGFSDHTLGPVTAIAAVALGAVMIEKHLTLDRTSTGPDHAVSMEPSEFAQMVRAFRVVEASLGDGTKEPTDDELEVARAARKSLVAVRDLPSGAVLSESDLVGRRPGTGIPASQRDALVGRRLKEPISAGDLFTPGHLE